MTKTAVVYASIHHQNTFRVANCVAKSINADILDVLHDNVDISQYDTIIFASGIYFGKFHKGLVDFVEKQSFEGKRVIAFYTCGMRFFDYARGFRKQLLRQGAVYLGDVYCRGYDAYGIWGKLGGVAKNHPTDKDIDHVAESIGRLLLKDNL